jgi:hypothetical protein
MVASAPWETVISKQILTRRLPCPLEQVQHVHVYRRTFVAALVQGICAHPQTAGRRCSYQKRFASGTQFSEGLP